MTEARNPKKSEYVSINDIEIYYETYGEGEPLMLLHGFTQSSVAWEKYIKEYSDDFEVYLIDLKKLSATALSQQLPFLLILCEAFL
jgi:alpha-beta hydrolase superfamily lysophospholipase